MENVTPNPRAKGKWAAGWAGHARVHGSFMVRVWGLRFRVSGLGFRVEGLGFRV